LLTSTFRERRRSDLLVLQVKHADRSVLQPYAGAAEQEHQGQLVMERQRLTQDARDILLAWTHDPVTDVDYDGRQLWDMDGRLDTQLVNERSLTCSPIWSGWTMARAHARRGEPAEIHGYLGSARAFDRAVTAFTLGYADQTENDYRRLREAVDHGELVSASDTLVTLPRTGGRSPRGLSDHAHAFICPTFSTNLIV
jgi:hypothetical protein